MHGFLTIWRPSTCSLPSRILIPLAIAAGLGWPSGGQAEIPAVPTNAVGLPCVPGIERETVARIDALVRAADAGEPTTQLAYNAAESGMSALWIAATRMNPDKLSHRAPLLLLAEQAATSRRTQRELLRLYDPPAYHAFYTPEGLRLQTWLATAMKWTNAPPNMPKTMVLAAPEPTLNWLETLDEKTLTNPPLLLAILTEWSSFAGMGRDDQHLPRLQAVARHLLENSTVQTQEPLLCAILQLISAVGGPDTDSLVATLLDHPAASVRCATATTLRRLGGDWALQALCDRAAKESDPAVQAALAGALGRWQKAPEAGDACLRLYGQAADADVRKAVLNAASTADWPTRGPLVCRAFESGNGAALVALAVKPEPKLNDALLNHFKNHDGQLLDPYLLDAVAVARITDAVPTLVDILSQEKNIAMRLKYIAALETIGDHTAAAALIRLLGSRRDDLETESAVASLGRLRYEPAIPALARIAKDAGVEIGIRVQAIWALGRMPSDRANTELDLIQQTLGTPAAGLSISVDMATHYRLVKPQLLLARFRTNPEATSDELTRMFAETGPLEQATLLAGLAEQERDHPIIAAGLESLDFPVLYMAIAAGKAAAPATYGPRVRRLASSPYIQALANISLETWNLRSLLAEGWR